MSGLKMALHQIHGNHILILCFCPHDWLVSFFSLLLQTTEVIFDSSPSGSVSWSLHRWAFL